MTKHRIDSLKSAQKLLRFLAWYAVIVAAAIYLLPLAGQWIQEEYESMSLTTRAFSVIVIFAVATAGQLASMRSRWKQSRGRARGSQGDSL